MSLGSASALAQSSSLNRPAAPVVLEVPYLPQSVLLCGGAAVAMVERWWGRRGVYGEDFADLVRPALGGIRTTDLAAAVRARGWDVAVERGSPETVRRHLRDGEPVVTLIQVGPDRYHYVVVLGWSEGRVVFHDPAGSPKTTLDEARFLARWTGADLWALVIRPPPPLAAPPPAELPDPVPADSMPCPPWLDLAVDAAAADRLDEADLLLADAGRACPAEPLVLRELAGVRFKQGRHDSVTPLVEAYLALVPGDRHAWQLLATSRYLTGNQDGALTAWNHTGRPVVDVIHIEGTRRIRYRDLIGVISLPPRTMLTPARLQLARRRLTEVPALRGAAVEYQPVAGGMVEVRVAVAERPMVDRAWRLVGVGAIRAVVQNEVTLDIASPTGAGELWSGKWRWDAARPRAIGRVDMPARFGFRGVVGVEGTWEHFRTVLDPSKTTVFEETRRAAAVGFGGWLTAGFRPSAEIRVERWSENRRYLAASMGAEYRAWDNRFGVIASAERAIALIAHPSYTRGGARAIWASSLGLQRAAWSSRLGFDWASPDAPLGTWPTAGGNLSWAIPLRAEPRGAGGLLTGQSTGRAILHAGLAADHPVYRVGPLVVAAGVFVDGAKVVHAADGSVRDRYQLDGGLGLRVGGGDGQLGVFRIDLAKGLLAGGRSALTVGVQRTWPPFHRGAR